MLEQVVGAETEANMAGRATRAIIEGRNNLLSLTIPLAVNHQQFELSEFALQYQTDGMMASCCESNKSGTWPL